MLYYSHVNEDNRIERQLLEQSGCSIVVCVAGSGERVLALMDLDACSELHVIDPNPDALYLLQLKLAALKQLSVENYLRFCGHETATRTFRLETFAMLTLLPECRTFWETRPSSIGKGVLNIGQYERFLSRIRPMVNLFLGKHFQRIFSVEGVTEATFPTQRWGLLCRLFAQGWVYRLFGNQDEAFVGRGANIELIPKALDQSIHLKEAPFNFMMHLLFKGHIRDMHEDTLPPSLKKEILAKTKEKLEQQTLHLNFHQTDALEFATSFKNPTSKPVFYSFSDILSFETPSYLDNVIEAAVKTGGKQFVWRSFLRNRQSMSDLHVRNVPGTVQLHPDESTRMYQVLSLQIPD